MQCLTQGQVTATVSREASWYCTFCVEYLDRESETVVGPDITDDDIEIFGLECLAIWILRRDGRLLCLFVILFPDLKQQSHS